MPACGAIFCIRPKARPNRPGRSRRASNTWFSGRAPRPSNESTMIVCARSAATGSSARIMTRPLANLDQAFPATPRQNTRLAAGRTRGRADA